MKILHTADWHLDSPFRGRSPEQAHYLKEALLALPGRIAGLCRAEGCELVLIAGDVFDGGYSKASLEAFRHATEEMAVPVFVSPGNHDYIGGPAPWGREALPGNVHVFDTSSLRSVELPELGCRVFGAAFTGPDSPSLLEGFRQRPCEEPTIGLFHGDPTSGLSAYNPVRWSQIISANFSYLALGHIHKGGSIPYEGGLCAWPGCPMGRGFDETGEKGVLLVTLNGGCRAVFRPLSTPRFHDLTTPAGDDPAGALETLLPPAGNRDLYRVTLTGAAEKPDLAALKNRFASIPYLELVDRTTGALDLWANAGADSLEGIYFQLLQEKLRSADDLTRRQILLAAELSRKILTGQEVTLP